MYDRHQIKPNCIACLVWADVIAQLQIYIRTIVKAIWTKSWLLLNLYWHELADPDGRQKK